MNDVEYFQRAFAYDDWANAGHLEGLAKNDSPAPEALRAMAHLLSARAIWLRRITGHGRRLRRRHRRALRRARP